MSGPVQGKQKHAIVHKQSRGRHKAIPWIPGHPGILSPFVNMDIKSAIPALSWFLPGHNGSLAFPPGAGSVERRHKACAQPANRFTVGSQCCQMLT